jgi:hypothetical protein
VANAQPLPGDYPITLYRGDTRTWSLAFTEDDETTPVDVSSFTFEAQVRETFDSSSVLLTLTVDDADADTGVLVLTLPAAQWTGASIAAVPTAKWHWDLQGTAGSEVRTFLAGKVKTLGDVTR